MRYECEHGTLRRKCPICERDEEITELKAEVARLTGRTVEAFVLARLEMEMIDHSLSHDLHDQALCIIAELRKNRRDLGGGSNAALAEEMGDR